MMNDFNIKSNNNIKVKYKKSKIKEILKKLNKKKQTIKNKIEFYIIYTSNIDIFDKLQLNVSLLSSYSFDRSISIERKTLLDSYRFGLNVGFVYRN